MGHGAKIGLVGVLALIVLVVAVWDKKNEERQPEAELARLEPTDLEALDPRVDQVMDYGASDDGIRGEIDENGPLAFAGPAITRRTVALVKS